ncbi:MAG TPA: DUF998 domain-containing protein [Chloroflexota bacterium]|nr:DUF998 domain-containing protein [Chloroflexota bacterium]
MDNKVVGEMDERRITGLTRLLLAGGVAGPILFIIVFLIEGATRPGYSPWRNFVSQLSTGEGGWVQIANFIMCGVLSLGFALALWSSSSPRLARRLAWGPALLALFSLALLAGGAFVTDPALGYPPGTPLGSQGQTWHGAVHGVAGLLAFGLLAAACFVYARRFSGDPEWRGWTAYSSITGTIIALGFIASTVTSVLDERGVVPNAPTGVIQRVAIIVGWGWIAIFALRLLRDPRLLVLLGQVNVSTRGDGTSGFKSRVVAIAVTIIVLIVVILVVLWLAGVFRGGGAATHGAIPQLPI